MKVLANDGISKSGQEVLEKAGFSVETTHVAQEQLENYINENQIEVLLVRSATKVRKDLIDATNLKMIGRGGVGMDNIDVEYAQSKGIHVFNTPAASSNSVAELVFAHLLGMVRFLHDANRNMPLEGETQFKTLKKSYSKSIELKGKTLGVIGLGRIGQEVARIGLGLGMNVIGSNRSGSKETKAINVSFHNGQNLNIEIDTFSIDEVLKQSDFITLHIPAQNGYVISEKEIKLMKDGAVIINAARGGVIDEKALVDALDNEKIAAAALDVFENEPEPELKLLMHPKLSLSPHIGGQTLEAQDRIGTELADQIINFYNEEKV